MPVYGKGRTGKKNSATGLKIIRLPIKGKKIKKRVFKRRSKWTEINNPLREINKTMGINLIIETKNLFKQKKRKVVVVDWGCGTGKAITELAAKCQKEANCYGFAQDSYREWKESLSVKYIQAEAWDFPRYFKDNSIDLMFSFSAFELNEPTLHGPWPYIGTDAYLVKYLEKIKSKFEIGGKLFVFPLRMVYYPKTADALESIGWEVKKTPKAIILTRKN